MKKKRRSDKVPALSNVDTEKEKPIVPPVNEVITAEATEPSSENGVTTAKQEPLKGGGVVSVTTYCPVPGFLTEKAGSANDVPSRFTMPRTSSRFSMPPVPKNSENLRIAQRGAVGEFGHIVPVAAAS
jgi:hypothetical protein